MLEIDGCPVYAKLKHVPAAREYGPLCTGLMVVFLSQGFARIYTDDSVQISGFLLLSQVAPHQRRAMYAMWAGVSPMSKRTEETLRQLKGRVIYTPEHNSTLLNYIYGETTLDLSTTSVNDATLNLKSLPRLKTLAIASTEVSDTVARSIAQCDYLRNLDISDTSLTDEFVARLVKLRHLTTVIANNTKISNASLPILASMSSLKKLECRGTLVTPPEASDLDNMNLNFELIMG